LYLVVKIEGGLGIGPLGHRVIGSLNFASLEGGVQDGLKSALKQKSSIAGQMEKLLV
jgi:hypothetical protein